MNIIAMDPQVYSLIEKGIGSLTAVLIVGMIIYAWHKM